VTPAPAPGRGRPPVFDAERQKAYLELVAAGVKLGEAAAKVNIDRRTVTYLTRRDPEFAERLTRARARGREQRVPHGTPEGYDNYDCRCGPCTKASSAARARRGGRSHTDEPAAEATEGEVIAWPEPDPPGDEFPSSFSLAKVS
jgi:hypothetical protein